MQSRRRVSSLVLAVTMVLAVVHPAGAQLKLPPIITSAVPDAANGVLVVRGVNFGANPPRVTLNSYELPVITAGPQEIIVALDANTPAASYLLVVYRGPLFGIFVVTIGASGPAGPRGAEGPQGVPGNDGAHGAPGIAGPPGTPGPTGNTGPAGPAGATGLSGATGATGATGPQGGTGDTGATGPQGADGPQGPAGLQGSAGVGGGGLNGTREFTTSGTFTVPTGVTHILVELWGAGGGGGGGSRLRSGGGGGSGAYVRSVVPVAPGMTYDIVIGSAGTGGPSASLGLPLNDGADGTDTEVRLVLDGTLLIAAAAGSGGGGADSSTGPVSTPGGTGGSANPWAMISRAGFVGGQGSEVSSGLGGGTPLPTSLLGGTAAGGNGGPRSITGLPGSSGGPGYAIIVW